MPVTAGAKGNTPRLVTAGAPTAPGIGGAMGGKRGVEDGTPGKLVSSSSSIADKISAFNALKGTALNDVAAATAATGDKNQLIFFLLIEAWIVSGSLWAKSHLQQQLFFLQNRTESMKA